MTCSVVLDRAHCCNVRTWFAQCPIRLSTSPTILPCHVLRYLRKQFSQGTLNKLIERKHYGYKTYICRFSLQGNGSNRHERTVVGGCGEDSGADCRRHAP